MTKEWQTEDGLKKVANYVKENIKNRAGVLNENRCDWFKGDRLLAVINPPPEEEGDKKKKKKKRPKYMESITSEDAVEVAKALLAAESYFMKVEKVKGSEKRSQDQKEIRLVKHQLWDDKGYYVWVWEGNQFWSNFMTGALVLGFLGITCFPIWPNFLKLVLWYISVTLLIIMFVTLMIRFLLFLFVWIFGYEFWVFPNLFDESLTVVESFKPVYSFEKTAEGQLWYRLAVLAGFGAFVYWAYTQPTEFDEFMLANKKFVDDLYEGNLLADVSQTHKDNLDKLKIPTIEDLLSDISDSEEYEENEQFHQDLGKETPADADEANEEDLDAMFDNLFDEDAGGDEDEDGE